MASGGGGGGDDADVCQSTDVQAMSAKLPVDIIWVIDNSGSMKEEEGYIKTNLNSFSSNIAASGVDYHVIVIADTSHITVPPPLGGSPQFMAINQNIDSHNALSMIISTYPQWQAFLRPNAKRHFVAVSDDESTMKAADFKTAVAGLTNPGFPNGFTFDAIVAENGPISIPPDHCFGLSSAKGQQYIDLQMQTGGVFASLCQTDWTPIFNTLSMAVVQGTSLPCTFNIPPPPTGQTLDFKAVNLVYTPTGQSATTIPFVGSMAACTAAGGWYYDNPAMPTQLIACPSTCDALKADATGMINVAFGCATVIP
jgi:hypothetical protein